MPETFDDLNKELVDSIRNLTSVHNEYSQKYISAVPLGDGPVPTFTFEELHEITERIKNAEKRYAIASQKMREFKNSIQH